MKATGALTPEVVAPQGLLLGKGGQAGRAKRMATARGGTALRSGREKSSGLEKETELVPKGRVVKQILHPAQKGKNDGGFPLLGKKKVSKSGGGSGVHRRGGEKQPLPLKVVEKRKKDSSHSKKQMKKSHPRKKKLKSKKKGIVLLWGKGEGWPPPIQHFYEKKSGNAQKNNCLGNNPTQSFLTEKSMGDQILGRKKILKKDMVRH